MSAAALTHEMKAVRKKAVCAVKSSVSCKFCPAAFKDAAELSKHLVLHLKNHLVPIS
jgi:pyruvate formate-lyase activating enzyme-like uncharacterized protein